MTVHSQLGSGSLQGEVMTNLAFPGPQWPEGARADVRGETLHGKCSRPAKEVVVTPRLVIGLCHCRLNETNVFDF